MVSASAAFSGNRPVPPSAPGEIRATLTGEEAADFDREYRLVLTEAAETMDLSGVLVMLKRWQRVAWSRADDPEAHRRMLEHAERLNAGRRVATEPWEETKAALGL
jgi:hypothetical protein